MASSSPSVNKIETAHQMYREGKYLEALDCYTDALSLAKTKPQKIALHSNRAACFLKLHHFNQAAEECTSVLELDHDHTGALMLRAQTLVTLKEYHFALFDVNRLIELNPSSEVYKNLQTRLRTQLNLARLRMSLLSNKGDARVNNIALAPIPEDEAEFEQEDDFINETKLEETEEAQDNKEVEELVSEENDRASDIAKANFDKSALATISPKTVGLASENNSTQKQPDEQSLSWNTVPKPKGHSNLDYSKWDSVEDDSSEDDDSDDEDSQPHYRFRVKNVGVRAVK